MREIKFRAFDKDYKMMIYPKAHYVEQGSFATQKQKDKEWSNYVLGEVYNPEENEYHTITRGDTRFILLQYTGLKDRNGKEIFEGDVMGYPNENYKDVVCFGEYNFEGDESSIAGVGFYFERYAYGFKQSQKTSIYFAPSRNNLVIGNIYENPELLDNQEGK